MSGKPQSIDACPSAEEQAQEIEAADALTVPLRGADSTQDVVQDDPAFRQLYRELWEMGRKYAPTLPPEGASGEASPAGGSQGDVQAAEERRSLLEELPAPFGRYLVRRKLGRGGMGAVYLAWDTQLERDVALKIPTTGRDQDAADRFLREARAAAALDHPHVCPIYDHGQIDGVPYLTLKLIDGRTLADALAAGPLTIRDAVEIARRVAEALGAAHRAGVTHRDLKPGNIMLDASGRPWVMDFGLARREAVDPELIEEGEIFGTPLYMSPEQAEGQGDRVGAPSDIFSLGVVLYEMLSGRTPFAGKVAEVLEKIRQEEPPPPSRHRPEIDARLDAICLKAMARTAQDRYATAGEMTAALDRYLHTLPTPMPGLDQTADDAQALRRQRRLHWTLAAAAVLLLALLGFFSLGGGRAVVEVARSWTASDPDVTGAAPVPRQAAPAPPDAFPKNRVAQRERDGEGYYYLSHDFEPDAVRGKLERNLGPQLEDPIRQRVELQMELQAQDVQGQSTIAAARATLNKNLGEVRAARAARWVVRFKRASAEDYLQQLGGLGAEIAFPESSDRYRYFTDVAEGRPPSLRALSQESRIYFIDDSPRSEEVAGLLGAAPPDFMCLFLPRPLEANMLQMELEYRGAEEDQIARSVFEVIPRGAGHDVIVVDQTAKSAAGR